MAAKWICPADFLLFDYVSVLFTYFPWTRKALFLSFTSLPQTRSRMKENRRKKCPKSSSAHSDKSTEDEKREKRRRDVAAGLQYTIFACSPLLFLLLLLPLYPLSLSLSIFLSHPLTLSAFDFSNWNYNINTEISSTEEKASQPAWLSASMAQWAAAIYLACSLWYREAAHEWMTDQTSTAAYCFIGIAGLHLLFLESVLTQSGWNA